MLARPRLALPLVALLLSVVTPVPARAHPGVLLEPWASDNPAPGAVNSLLIRELVRQEFLRRARCEHDLVVRDAVLAEPAADLELERWRAEVRAIGGASVAVVLRQRTGSAWQERAAFEVPFPNHTDVAGFVTDLQRAAAEPVGRALSDAAGGKRDRAPVRPALDTLDQELLTPELLSCLFVCRALDTPGRAAEWRLDAEVLLARAYGGAAFLSAHAWSARDRVFAARALLTAEEAVRRHPGDASALAARAWARALTGLHGRALQDIAAARAAGGDQTADLLDALEGFCRFDIERLDALVAADGASAGWAALFGVAILDGTGSQRQLMDRLARATRRLPRNLRLAQMEFEQRQLGTSRIASARQLWAIGDQIAGHAGRDRWASELDAIVRGLAGPADESAIAHVASALDGDAPPGLAASLALARLPRLRSAARRCTSDQAVPGVAEVIATVDDLLLRAAESRLIFLGDLLGVDNVACHAAVVHLLGDHPLAPYLATRRSDTPATRWDELLRDLPLDDCTLRAEEFIERRDGLARERPAFSVAWRHADATATDVCLRMDRMETADCRNWLPTLEWISPHNPHVAIFRATCRWGQMQNELDAVKERYGRFARVLTGVAHRLQLDGRFDEATRWLRAALDLGPSHELYWRLADLHVENKDPEAAIGVLRESLDCPDAGLAHARARTEIVKLLARAGRYTEALPVAEQAARTYQAMALLCAGYCHEALGNLPAAERYFRAVAERYDNLSMEWIMFCLRTTSGDRTPAAAHAVSVLAHQLEQGFPVHGELALAQLCAGARAAAAPLLATSFERQAFNPSPGLWSALLRLELGERDESLALLDRVIREGPAYTRGGSPRTALLTLAKVAREAIEVGHAPAREQLDALADDAGDDTTAVALFAGMLCRSLGDDTVAAGLFRRAAADPQRNRGSVLAARIELGAAAGSIEPVPPHMFWDFWLEN